MSEMGDRRHGTDTGDGTGGVAGASGTDDGEKDAEGAGDTGGLDDDVDTAAGDALAVRPSERVVEAVASARDTDATAIEERLHGAVEADALDRIVRDAPPSTTVRFRYAGYLVTVRGDGSVEAIPADG
ncbi:HalOD1 output domain-containing protein [Halobaculum sp. EA56]|uniref:HalOD1 output domain-containing protein n=1 Tax=Halobaculum sp. EA56 TaxID=3421648 RepID=UPI003EB743E1